MAVPADWYLDPTSRNERRYWDGARWTERVVDADGNESLDSLKDGREQVDLLAWPDDVTSSDEPLAPTLDRAATRAVRDRKTQKSPDERHRIIIASSMVTGTLWLGLVSLAVAFVPLLGPAALIGGLVTVWFSLLAPTSARDSSDVEAFGPMRNALIGILAMSVGAVSTALLVVMLRGGDVAILVACFGQTTEASQCWTEFARSAVERVRW